MKPAHSTDQNKGRYETGETIQEKVKLYSADRLNMISVIESLPYFYISYTKSSISTKTGRQEVHRGAS